MGKKMADALLGNDWHAFEGQAFDMLKREIHVCKPFKIPDNWRMVGGMDYGNTTCLEVIAFNPGNGDAYYCYEWTMINKERSAEIDSLKYYLKTNGLQKLHIVYDVNMNSVNSKIPTEKTTAWYFKNDESHGFRLDMQTVSKSRIDGDTLFNVSCNREFWERLDWKKSDNGLWLRKPKMYFMAKKDFEEIEEAEVVCENLFETMFNLQDDPEYPGNILPVDPTQSKTRKINHWYDAGKYALITGIKSEGLTQEEKKQIEKAVEQDIEESLW
jgi:hypothetical protein